MFRVMIIGLGLRLGSGLGLGFGITNLRNKRGVTVGFSYANGDLNIQKKAHICSYYPV